MEEFVRNAWSTADVGDADAFGYWSDAICEAFVGVSVRPSADVHFEGRVDHAVLDGIGFTVVSSFAQQVARTRRMIARDHEDFVLANIQIEGQAQVRQNGRVTALSAGAMAFVDSSRPYSLSFSGAFSQLVVKVPRSLLPRRSLPETTAVELSATGPGRLVADFLLGLNRQQSLNPKAAAALVPHAIGLLDTALDWTVGERPTNASAAALTRERVHRFVRRHVHDPYLDADAVAAGCGLSKRTLFRALAADGESLTTLIRRLRVARAQQILRAAPGRPLTVVAHECGFGGESQLHRAFKAVTGITPGTYRSGGSGVG
ncbi:hypothetical protein Pth03_49590 [Planotetraspora thailandica]|uniref:HTH araC/xylS-type domain-containing protein n=1 Tax=Planotetraspora thailandica TaxID=487172 RepID=A0A8J3XXW0_9ACTN|nr:helix-turn-helix domain-containing protein [Planotetraspora thailandica]GII56570.1 hypothetical protein Pth03_49590 [Planotetraspora thailandica]